jgi:hypothetical protein
MNSSLTTAIKNVRQRYDLRHDYVRLRFNDFTTIARGEAFKINNKWKISGLCMPTYLVSYTNSYQMGSGKSYALEYHRHYITSTYLSCCVFLEANVPDTIIQPHFLAERLVDLLLHHNIKLDGKSLFNAKYLLQSVDKDKLLPFLSNGLIDTIEKYDNLHMEIRNNQCLIYYQHAVCETDGLVLAEIAERFCESFAKKKDKV